MGGEFEGLYDFNSGRLSQPSGDSKAFEGKTSDHEGLDAATLEQVLTPAGVNRLREEAELAQAGYSEFDLTAFQNGDLTPVYFGSALKEFGVVESPALFSRCRPIWTRNIATALPSCVCVRAPSNAA
jgi:peptide chain release factor 3